MYIDDWVKKNWDFLSARAVKVETTLPEMLKDWRIPTDGKFFGTDEFFKKWGYTSGSKHDNFRKLFLRPYVVQEMPDGVGAVYISKKGYEFDEEGYIVGLKSTFEKNFYILK